MRLRIFASIVVLSTSFCWGQTTWTGTGTGDWTDPADWTAGVPNSIDASANFDTTASNTFVNVDQPVIVGQLNITSGPWLYLIQGASPIILNSDTGPAQLNDAGAQNVILAPVTIASDTTINVAAGAELSISSDLSSDGVNLTYTGGGSLTVPYIRAFSLNIQQGAVSMFEDGSNNTISTLSSLTIAPGQVLDLANNSLIINYSGASPLATITSEIADAYDNGKWDKPGLTSSDAASHAGAALGVGDAATLGITNFQGQLVGNAVIVKYTWYGDANLDGKVDSADLALMNQGRSEGLSGWMNGDFNYDGVINSDDYALFTLGLEMQNSAAVQVPEPLSANLIGFIVLLLPGRHRAKKIASAII